MDSDRNTTGFVLKPFTFVLICARTYVVLVTQFATTIPLIASIALMADLWLGDDPKDVSAAALGKVKNHLLSGKLLEVSAGDEIIRLKQGPSRHANTKPDGCVLSVALTLAPSSQRTELIQMMSELFIARTVVGHLTLATFRRYRMISTDHLGIETSNDPVTPSIWSSFQRFASFSPGAFLVKY